MLRSEPRRFGEDISHLHFPEGWSKKSPIILDATQIQYLKYVTYLNWLMTSCLRHRAASARQQPKSSEWWCLYNVAYFSNRHSIRAHYDGRGILAAYLPSLCCLQAVAESSGNLPSTKSGKTCVCYWAIAAMLDKYKGRKHSSSKKHKLQMDLSTWCGQHILQSWEERNDSR